jgi:hypothetical protein
LSSESDIAAYLTRSKLVVSIEARSVVEHRVDDEHQQVRSAFIADDRRLVHVVPVVDRADAKQRGARVTPQELGARRADEQIDRLW